MNRFISHLSKGSGSGGTPDSHREIALRQPLNDVVCAEFRIERTGQRAAMATPSRKHAVLEFTAAAAVVAGKGDL